MKYAPQAVADEITALDFTLTVPESVLNPNVQ